MNGGNTSQALKRFMYLRSRDGVWRDPSGIFRFCSVGIARAYKLHSIELINKLITSNQHLLYKATNANKLNCNFMFLFISCLRFRASLICINKCPTRCNTKQSIYYSASSIYMFRVSTTPIIRITQNCNYNLRYWSYFRAATSLQRGQATTPIIRSTQNCNYSLR